MLRTMACRYSALFPIILVAGLKGSVDFLKGRKSWDKFERNDRRKSRKPWHGMERRSGKDRRARPRWPKL